MALFFSFTKLFLQYSFLFFSFTYLINPSSCFQRPLCDDGDRSFLLQFKQSFVFDDFYCDPSTDYTKLSSWKVSDDCCSWDGVECDEQTDRVIGLDLSSSCLFGSIHSSSPLFQLLHLTSLDLSLNNFNLSRIPGGIGSFPELKHLNLSFGNFSGQIPSEFLELSKLVSLDLRNNSYLMLQKPGLKDVAETLTSLVELRLSGVNVSSRVPQSLSNLTSLTSLLLKDCSLHGRFPPAIFQLPNLRVLNLMYNPVLTGHLPEFPVGSLLEALRFEGTGFSGQLPVSVGNLKSLITFDVRGCGLVGKIPSSIGNLTNLKNLDLSGNDFSGNIPSSLGNLSQLTFLSLRHNNFTSSTFHWFGKLSHLEMLDLTRTNLYGPIPSSFRNLTRLQGLWLGYNQLTGQIPSWMGNLSDLFFLDGSGNALHGPIPESIFQLASLELLYLEGNNLSGSLKFESFLQLKYLSHLQLSGNSLSLINGSYINATLPKFQILGLAECNVTEFPSFLCDQNELEFLELSSNDIKGSIPDWISTLESLTFMSLAYNSLSSFEHPLSILPLTNLYLLDLENNKFEGPLPIPPPSINTYRVSQNKFIGDISPFFCNLKSLSELDLSSNNLSGNLPSCLGNFASVLNVNNNSFSGEILNKFTSGCTLKVMDFSQNFLDGKVPNSLANCSKLEILNLQENNIDDVFPSWLGILPSLRVLSLKSNNFHGKIGKPLSKSEFSQLQIIDLSHNYFTGKLPLEYIRNWIAMKNVDDNHLEYMHTNTNGDDDQLEYMHTNTSFLVSNSITWTAPYQYSIRIVIKGTERAYDRILEFFVVIDLSSNRLEGEIPEILGTLSELQSLNLSNNVLTGHIPWSLGNLTKLEALDLSLNNLSGVIPAQLAFLTFLAVFNVSHNSLTGPIPHGRQFDTFENDSFFVNQGLCGHPLSRRCGDTRTLPLPTSEDEDEESSFEWNWEIVLMGFGSGLVAGVAYGYAMDTRKYEWLARKRFARWRSRRN